MQRTKVVTSRPGFVIDPASVTRTGGVAVDWDNVAADADGNQRLKAGTLLVEGANGVYPRKEEQGTGKASLILATDADKDSHTDSLTGYGAYRGGYFYKTLLPDSGEANFDTWLGELGAMFAFDDYKDVKA